MDVLVLGGGGMLGQKLAGRIARDGRLAGRRVTRLTLVDVLPPGAPIGSSVPIESVGLDLARRDVAARLVAGRPEVIFHLAAVVSGEAEVDFEKGYAVNLDGTQMLLEAIRAIDDYVPRLVFASSLAVFGPPFPDPIPDDFAPQPATSYGAQKLIAEILIADYSRRGFLDGLSLRLPTVCIRPGAPNRAASGFFSAILREPLVGLPAMLPVPDTARQWFVSPRAATEFFVHAAALDTAALGQRRALNMPGLSVTVAEQVEALRKIAGPDAVALIRREPDPLVAGIVAGWASAYEPKRALELGFVGERSVEEIIATHIEDELGGTLVVGTQGVPA
jgi:D-erythronate 2-dehydrogenase